MVIAGSTSVVRVCALLVACLALAAGCDRASSPNDEGNPATGERRAMLENIGQNVILATYVDFEAAAGQLLTATSAWQASASADDRAAARQAWRDAIALWQQAELYQLGPAGVMGDVAGGEDLRDEIYSWPLVNACRIDQETVEQAYADPGAFATEPVNVRGLDALEVLLFTEGTENRCAPNSSINTSGDWSALDDAELDRRRAAYAVTVATLVRDHAADLRTRWSPEGGNFLGQLAGADQGTDTYGSTQDALNALSDAMFYLDTEVKDMKLAEPAGLANCLEETCPEARESTLANDSLAHLRNNMAAFRRLFLGDDGPGFDDLLRDVGAAEVADDMTQRIDEAVAALDAIEGTLVEALANDPQSVITAYGAVKGVTDELKTRFVGVLNLELPDRAEADND